MGTRAALRYLALILSLACVGLCSCQANQPPAGRPDPITTQPALMPALPSPADLVGKTAQATPDIIQGSENDPAVTPGNFAPSGTDGVYSPSWVDSSSSAAYLAYALYVFTWDLSNSAAQVSTVWTTEPQAGKAWVGIGNIVDESWDWYPVVGGQTLVPDAMENVIPGGYLYVVVLLTGTREATLDRLECTGYIPAELSVYNEPAEGDGTAGNPFVIDARLTQFLILYYFPEGDVSGDVRAAYLVEPLAAGSVLPNITQASLHVADGFTGDFSVGATFDGFPSEPARIYFTAQDNGPGTNEPPVAVLSAEPTFGPPQIDVTFDARESTDVDGVIKYYRWDFDGDGNFEQTGEDRIVIHRYTAGGTFNAKLEVEDDQGAKHSATIPITVSTGSETWHLVQVRAYVAGERSSVGRYCGLCDVGGQPAIAFSEVDETGPATRLCFMRASDANGTAWGDPLELQRMANAADATGVDVQMKQVDGQPAVCYADHTTGYALYYERAKDALGADWSGDRALADTTAGASRGTYCQLLDLAGVPAMSYYDSTDKQLMFVTGQDANGAAFNTPLVLDTPGVDGDISGVGEYNSLALIDGLPAVAYLVRHVQFENGYEVRYLRASDATGSAWGTPVQIAQAPTIGYGTALLEMAGGLPGVAFMNQSPLDPGAVLLTFVRGTTADGATWSTGVDIMTMPSTGWLYSPQIYMYGGKPAVACLTVDKYGASDTIVSFSQAQEADGASWQGAQTIDSFAEGYCLSSCLVAGRPAMCYGNISDDALWFAIYY